MLPARRPYEDELLSSAVLRCCRQFNIREWKLGTVVLNQPGWRPSFLGVSALPKLGKLFRLPSERLLWNHTAFPYATAPMERNLFERTAALAISEEIFACRPSAILKCAKIGQSFRRFCEQCAEDELTRYRESYWHREHHLPGAWLCRRHATVLRETDIPVQSPGPLDWSLPHECSSRTVFDRPVPDSMHHLLRISSEWLYRPKHAFQHMDARHYRRLAVQAGWLKGPETLHCESNWKVLRLIFPPQFWSEVGLTAEYKSPHWAVSMLQPGTKRRVAPVSHAVLHVMLGTPRPAGISPLDGDKGEASLDFITQSFRRDNRPSRLSASSWVGAGARWLKD